MSFMKKRQSSIASSSVGFWSVRGGMTQRGDDEESIATNRTERSDSWYAFHSEKHNREYYYNPHLKIATWVLPTSDQEDEDDDEEEEDSMTLSTSATSTLETTTRSITSALLHLLPSNNNDNKTNNDADRDLELGLKTTTKAGDDGQVMTLITSKGQKVLQFLLDETVQMGSRTVRVYRLVTGKVSDFYHDSKTIQKIVHQSKEMVLVIVDNASSVTNRGLELTRTGLDKAATQSQKTFTLVTTQASMFFKETKDFSQKAWKQVVVVAQSTPSVFVLYWDQGTASLQQAINAFQQWIQQQGKTPIAVGVPASSNNNNNNKSRELSFDMDTQSNKNKTSKSRELLITEPTSSSSSLSRIWKQFLEWYNDEKDAKLPVWQRKKTVMLCFLILFLSVITWKGFATTTTTITKQEMTIRGVNHLDMNLARQLHLQAIQEEEEEELAKQVVQEEVGKESIDVVASQEEEKEDLVIEENEVAAATEEEEEEEEEESEQSQEAKNEVSPIEKVEEKNDEQQVQDGVQMTETIATEDTSSVQDDETTFVQEQDVPTPVEEEQEETIVATIEDKKESVPKEEIVVSLSSPIVEEKSMPRQQQKNKKRKKKIPLKRLGKAVTKGVSKGGRAIKKKVGAFLDNCHVPFSHVWNRHCREKLSKQSHKQQESIVIDVHNFVDQIMQ